MLIILRDTFFPDLMIVASDRVTWSFNVSGASRAVALDTSKTFTKVWYAGRVHKLRFRAFLVRLSALFPNLSVTGRLDKLLDGKSLQECPINPGVAQDSILGSKLSCYALMTFLMMLLVILLSKLMILLSPITVIKVLICGNNLSWLPNMNSNLFQLIILVTFVLFM